MADREQIQLIIDILGQEGLEQLARAAEKVRASTKAAADSYEILDTVVAKSVGGAGTYDVIIEKTAEELRREAEELARVKAAVAEKALVETTSLPILAKLTYATDEASVALDEQARKAVEATRTQKFLAAAMGEVAGPASAATAALTRLGGERAAGGMGALGAAYGLQDVITVLSMGGGWGRALMSATNNLTPMLLGLGMGGGLAGAAGLAFTAIAALGPVLDGLGLKLDSTSREKIPEATDKIERLTRAVKEDGEAVEELRKKRELDYFEMTKYIEQTGRLGDKERELAEARKARSVGPGDTRAHAERGAAFKEALGEYGGGDRLIGALGRAGVDEKRAERMIADALAGARGSAGEIQGRLRGRGAAEQIGYIPPEQKRRAVRQREATDAALKGNAGRREEARREGERHGQILDQMQEHEGRQEEKARRDRDREAAEQQRDLERSNAEHRRGAPARRKAALGRRADEALAHGPEIVGRAFGPQAAAMAAKANPAEVQDMKERTIKNLEGGQAPYQAVLDAFREVAEAAQRNARDAQRFGAQMNGLREQSRSHSQRFGDTQAFGG